MPITGLMPVSPPDKRNQFARDEMRRKVGPGNGQQFVERFDRVALSSEVERNEVGLAAGQHGNRRSGVAEMAAVMKFRQDRLDGAVAAVDRQNRGLDAGDGPHRLADLVGGFDLIMENVGMFGAKGADQRQLGKIARRLWVADQGDPRPGHQLPTGPTLRPLT